MLTNVDENGKTIADELKGKAKVLKPIKIVVEDIENPIKITEFEITDYDSKKYNSLKDYYDSYYKAFIAQLD